MPQADGVCWLVSSGTEHGRELEASVNVIALHSHGDSEIMSVSPTVLRCRN